MFPEVNITVMTAKCVVCAGMDYTGGESPMEICQICEGVDDFPTGSQQQQIQKTCNIPPPLQCIISLLFFLYLFWSKQIF